MQNATIAVVKDGYCEKILFEAMSNLEKRNGLYYSFLKKYIFEFSKNDSKTKKKLKKIISLLQNNVNKVGEQKAILNLCSNLEIDKNTKINGELIYLKLYLYCINNSSIKLTCLLNNN